MRKRRHHSRGRSEIARAAYLWHSGPGSQPAPDTQHFPTSSSSCLHLRLPCPLRALTSFSFSTLSHGLSTHEIKSFSEWIEIPASTSFSETVPIIFPNLSKHTSLLILSHAWSRFLTTNFTLNDKFSAVVNLASWMLWNNYSDYHLNKTPRFNWLQQIGEENWSNILINSENPRLLTIECSSVNCPNSRPV